MLRTIGHPPIIAYHAHLANPSPRTKWRGRRDQVLALSRHHATTGESAGAGQMHLRVARSGRRVPIAIHGMIQIGPVSADRPAAVALASHFGFGPSRRASLPRGLGQDRARQEQWASSPHLPHVTPKKVP